MMSRDWKHWTFSLGRWRIARWCVAAPCGRTGLGAHPVTIWRAHW